MAESKFDFQIPEAEVDISKLPKSPAEYFGDIVRALKGENELGPCDCIAVTTKLFNVLQWCSFLELGVAHMEYEDNGKFYTFAPDPYLFMGQYKFVPLYDRTGAMWFKLWRDSCYIFGSAVQ